MQKYYANSTSISQSKLENSIEITAEQYNLAMKAKLNGQVVEVVNDTLVINAPYVKVTAFLKTDCTQQTDFDDKTLVTDDHTLEIPKTYFDVWTAESWVTDLQKQYQAQVKEVTERRAYLYLDVDRLRNEATNVMEIEGDEVKAQEYKQQATALYLKIRAENPWPTFPPLL